MYTFMLSQKDTHTVSGSFNPECAVSRFVELVKGSKLASPAGYAMMNKTTKE